MKLTKMDINADFEFVPTEDGRYYLADEVDRLLEQKPAEIQEMLTVQNAKYEINDKLHALFCREDVSSWDLRQILGEIAGNIDEYILLVMAELDEISESQEY